MEFSLDNRTAEMSVGEFASFSLGPREGGERQQGIWRAQLGTQWHQTLRERASATDPKAEFEISVSGGVFHQGWLINLAGRIDQRTLMEQHTILREIKTIVEPLPQPEEDLRALYPEYFVQLAAYLALTRMALPAQQAPTSVIGELVFVELSSGVTQRVVLSDDRAFTDQLGRIVEFLENRWRARERLRALRFNPPFATLRPGQESTESRLRDALATRSIVLFEAPTGFGKTGILLELALRQMQAARCERVLYLTSKATGQLQVVTQLEAMIDLGAQAEAQSRVAVWHVRNKQEHCVNTVYQCSRDTCRYLADLERKWAQSGLSRWCLTGGQPPTIEDLRARGRNALLCPYEITRAALPFSDVWIGDYNYVFAPANQSLFYGRLGFDPQRTLLLVDEAHNLPGRVADAYSHQFTLADATLVSGELHRVRPPAKLVNAWDHWVHFLRTLAPTEALSARTEDEAADLLKEIANALNNTPLDTAALNPAATELLYQASTTSSEWEVELPRLWWSPRPGELSITCLDAADAIGTTLREFRQVVLASGTLSPVDGFAAAVGLEAQPEPAPPAAPPSLERLGELTKRDTRKLFGQLTSGAALLKVEEAAASSAPQLVRAETPWRDGAYDVAIDVRVDTSYQQRAKHRQTTAQTIAALAGAAKNKPAGAGLTVAFFSSYAYAEDIFQAASELGLGHRFRLQPRLSDLAAQTAWVEASLADSDALFLVLGSSFAEGIDLLGGRVANAIVVGPALPEVNAVQRAKLGALSTLSREEAFRRVYAIPGMQKVNQALGRLVRAPGQHARALLHCRRFAENRFDALLAPEYRGARHLQDGTELEAWLATASVA